MKKLILLFVALVFVSCSNEEIADPVTKTNLSSIRFNDYHKNVLINSQDMLFENEKLTTVKNFDNTHSDYTYNEQNLVSKIIDYNPSGEILVTTTFLYNSAGKITEMKQVSTPANEQNLNAKFVFTHLSGKIVLIKTTENNPPQSLDILFNSNNEIEKRTTFLGDYFFKYDFVNGNLEKSTQVGNNGSLSERITNYKYTNLKNKYSYKKLLYGKEWKLNSYLSSFLNFNSSIMIDLSENLISEYTETQFFKESNWTVIFTSKEGYTFDDKNRMTKMTEDFSMEEASGKTTNYNSEFIFTYKD